MIFRRTALEALVNRWLLRGDSECASELELLMSDVKYHGFADFQPEEHRRISAKAGHASAAKRARMAS